MATKTRKGKTLNQMLSQARNKFNWLKKLQKNVGGHLSRLDDFELPSNLNPPKTPNTLTLTYIGEETPEAVLKARKQVERVFETTLDEKNTVVAKCGRVTLTITFKMPEVTLEKVA